MAIKKSDNSLLRWFRIAARTAHLAAISLYVGDVWFQVPEAQLQIYFVGLVLSGAVLMSLFFNKNANWLMQNRGVVILFKLLLISQLSWLGTSQIYVLFFILVISSIVSHAPGSLRYYSVFHRRRID